MPNSFESFFMYLAVFVEMIFDKFLSRTMELIFLPSDAKNLRQYLVFSVLPAPDSPLITMDWFLMF